MTMTEGKVWPDDYVSEDNEFRSLVGYKDEAGKFQEVTLVVSYRDGMSLQEAFDEARAKAMKMIGESPKLREFIENHLEQLQITMEPRMGPLPPEGATPTAEF
jgi:hypothetical protein